MNWDISIGHLRQIYGRSLQAVGGRFESRKMTLAGERSEFAGRLQARYGTVKHQAQWSWVSSLSTRLRSHATPPHAPDL